MTKSEVDNELKIKPGGLMRCCNLSLEEMYNTGELNAKSMVECKYCKNLIKKVDGVWGWAPEGVWKGA